jgi:hypothetical protein
MHTVILTQFFLGLLAITIVYIIGKGIICNYTVNILFFNKLFITLAIGIVSMVYLFSIFQSVGKTINIILSPFIIYFIYHYRTSNNTPILCWAEIKKEMLWSIILFSIIFLYQSLFYIDFHNGCIKPLNIDFYEHSSYSNSLRLYGAENNFVDILYYFPELRNKLAPYHYGELWLNALFSKLFGNSSVNTLYFITNGVLIATFCTGICSLFENKIKKNISIVSFSILCLFITNIYSSQISMLSEHSNPWDGTIMGLCFQKQAFISIFGLLGFILLIQKRKVEGTLILLSLPVFSVALLPGIITGIILYEILEIIESGMHITKTQIVFIVLPLLFILSYYVFYRNYQIQYNADNHNILKTFEDLKRRVSLENIMRYFIISILFFLPFIILLLKTSLSLYRYWLFIAFCLLGGILAFSITSSISNTNQFYTNINSLSIIILIISFSIFITNTTSNLKHSIVVYLFSTIVILNTIVMIYGKLTYCDEPEDAQFLKSISKYITLDVTPILTFNSTLKKGWYYSFYKMPLSLNQYTDKTIILSSGNPEFYRNHETMTKIDSLFYFKFTPLTIWRSKGTDYTLETFIAHFNIKHFFFKKGIKVPLYIKQRVYKVFESPLTHNTFIVIH